MQSQTRLVRPPTFDPEQEYWWLQINQRPQDNHRLKDSPMPQDSHGGIDARQAMLIPVRFVSYDPHPAFIIVDAGSGRMRCPRDELFSRP